MKDIIVTLPKGDLNHLQEKIDVLEEGYSWWDLKQEPKDLTEENNVFVNCKGFVRGYFTIDEILWEGKYETAKAVHKFILNIIEAVGIPQHPCIRIVFAEWVPIQTIKMKGFQGFRYRNFNYKISQN